VGLVFCPNFVAANPVTLDDVLQQFDHLLEKAGVDSVVIGADFVDYFVEEMRVEIERHPDLYDEGSLHYPEGIETVRSMQNFVAGIEQRGLGEEALDRIARGNFLRLLAETQALAGVPATAA
jgi:membrane dipeptidase